MKKLLAIVVLGLLWSGNVYAVQDRWLSIWYNNCSEAGHGHKYCKCNIEVIDQKLSNSQFIRLMEKSWEANEWMLKNVHPVCRKHLK